MSEPNSINGETQLLSLFGGRLRHSPSPATHTRWAMSCGLNIRYTALETPTEHHFRALAESLMASPHFLGGNITNPFKPAALQLQKVRIDEPARRCGAGNTLYRRNENGEPEWSLTNTDLVGCSVSLRKILELPARAGIHVGVVILGAGAMTRTCLAALDDVSQSLNFIPSVFIVSRRPPRQPESRPSQPSTQTVFQPSALGLEDPIWAHQVQTLTPQNSLLICINTLPSGTSEEAKQATCRALATLNTCSTHWAEKHLFCMTYGRHDWHLFAESLGWSVLSGDLLFECQARASFKLWTGYDAPNLPTALRP